MLFFTLVQVMEATSLAVHPPSSFTHCCKGWTAGQGGGEKRNKTYSYQWGGVLYSAWARGGSGFGHTLPKRGGVAPLLIVSFQLLCFIFFADPTFIFGNFSWLVFFIHFLLNFPNFIRRKTLQSVASMRALQWVRNPASNQHHKQKVILLHATHSSNALLFSPPSTHKILVLFLTKTIDTDCDY